MSCSSGNPCLGTGGCGCASDPCNPNNNISCENVIYSGPTLSCSSVENNDTLCVALQKLDDKICNPPAISVTASNGLYKDLMLNDIRLGGPLTEPTIIQTSASYVLAITGLTSDLLPDYILTQTTIGAVRKIPATTLASNILGYLSADNGITKTAYNFQLGGALVKPTTITTTNVNTLSISGLVNNPSAAYVVAVDNTTGLLTKSSLSSIVPPQIIANNGLTKTGNIVQLGGNLIQNTDVELDGNTLILTDTSTGDNTGVTIVPGIADPLDWSTANVNILSGKVYLNKQTWLDNNANMAIGTVAPDDLTTSPRLSVLKSTVGTSVPSNATTESKLKLPTGFTLSSTNAYVANSNILEYYPSINITMPENIEKTISATYSQFIFEPSGLNGDTISAGRISASAARGYFAYDRNLDTFAAYRAMSPITDSGHPFDGTLGECIGFKVENQRANVTISNSTIETYGFKQLGAGDRNYFAGGFQLPITNASIGTATLVSGTKIVTTTAARTGSRIFVTHNTPSGTMGHLSAPVGSIVDGVSFVINSSSATDNSTVNWWIINI